MILSEELVLELTEKYCKQIYGVKPNSDIQDEIVAYMHGLHDGASLKENSPKIFKGGEFYITPRLWGKTTQCIEEFMTDPVNSLLIVKDFNTREKLIKSTPCLEKYKDKIKAAEGHILYGIHAKKIFVDEYDSFRVTTQMNLSIDLPNMCEELFVFTSMIDEPDFKILSSVRNLTTIDKKSYEEMKLLPGDLISGFITAVIKMERTLISNRLMTVSLIKGTSYMKRLNRVED